MHFRFRTKITHSLCVERLCQCQWECEWKAISIDQRVCVCVRTYVTINSLTRFKRKLPNEAGEGTLAEMLFSSQAISFLTLFHSRFRLIFFVSISKMHFIELLEFFQMFSSNFTVAMCPALE